MHSRLFGAADGYRYTRPKLGFQQEFRVSVYESEDS